MATQSIMNRLTGRLAGLVIFLTPLLASACEGCKSSAQSGGVPNAIGEAFGYSIYFMLAVPTLLMVGLVRMMIRHCRLLDEQHALVLAPAVVERSERDFGGMGGPIPAR